MNRMHDLILGTLYGVAVGDALGAPLEFMRQGSIRQRHGTVRDMIGGGWLGVEPGEVTDDTQMTLCVANGIISQPEDPISAIGQNFIRWYESQPKDIGTTCARAIHWASRSAVSECGPTASDWESAARRVHQSLNGRSAGNGSLMRTAYVGLYYTDADDVVNWARQISSMTHFDSRAGNACAAYSAAIHSLLTSDSGPDDGRSTLIPNMATMYGGAQYAPSALSGDSFAPNPSGFVEDSFQAALHCIYTTTTFEDAVVKAVNLGGDADTVGAITGGLAGALYGFDAIPTRWKRIQNGTARQIEEAADAALRAWDH